MLNKRVKNIFFNYSSRSISHQQQIKNNRHLIHYRTNWPQDYKPLFKFNDIPSLKGAINPRFCSIVHCNQFNLDSVPINMEDSHQLEFAPPSSVRGMTNLNRDAFVKHVRVPTIKVRIDKLSILRNKKFTKKLKLKTIFLKFRGVKPITALPDDDEMKDSHKALVLNPQIICDGNFKEGVLEILTPLLENEETQEIKYTDLTLTYDNWSYSDILRAVLPENSTGIGGFSLVGHILHLNMNAELLEYKSVIGNVLLDKTPTVKTVINKLNIIDNTFRNFQMEVLAGEPDFVTTVKEHGFTYKMDFSKVYWNPRLGQEHTRIVEELNAGDTVFDAFAGIGPFAIPAAKKECHVFANDLNPESFRWLNENITINKVKNIKSFNLDGREFLKTAVKDKLVEMMTDSSEGCKRGDIHIVMNLPALAIEFTDVFPGLLSDVDKSTLKHIYRPKVHCYCFTLKDQLEEPVRERIEAAMQWSLPNDTLIRVVRDVAPSKYMMCASFQLSENVMFDNPRRTFSETESPPVKKFKEDTASESTD